MKNILYIFISFFMVFSTLSGCIKKEKKEDDKPTPNIGNITHNDNDYPLSDAFIGRMHDEDSAGVYSFFLLMQHGFTIHYENGVPDSASGIGNYVSIGFNSSDSSKIPPGTYSFDTTYSYVPGTFNDYSAVGYNYNNDTDAGPFFEVVGGSVTVSKDASVYNITFNFDAVDTNSQQAIIMGNYTGTAPKYNISLALE